MSKELFCVNGIYSDGMVLQREVTNCATGSAEPFSKKKEREEKKK